MKSKLSNLLFETEEKEETEQQSLCIMLGTQKSVAKKLQNIFSKIDLEPDTHLTISWIGSIKELDKKEAIRLIVKRWAKECGSIKGRINGVAKFAASESSDNKKVYVVLFDSAGLPEKRHDLETKLREEISWQPNHGFIPHITLAYTNEDMELPNEIPDFEVIFDRVILSWSYTSKEEFLLEDVGD